MMDQTFDQFGGGLPLGDGDAWPEVERAPVSIAVPWTEPGPPAPETIADDMRSRAGRTVDLLGAEIGPEDTGLLWSAVFSVEGLTAPIFVWLEETDAPTAQHATDMAGVPEHKWTMVWQTRLDGADPVADWGLVLRTIGLSWPGTPAVHDVELSRWIMREEMVEPLLADEELEPAVESLWWVSASQREPGSPAWLKTTGMNRLGLPELEFLEVPVPLVPTSRAFA